MELLKLLKKRDEKFNFFKKFRLKILNSFPYKIFKLREGLIFFINKFLL